MAKKQVPASTITPLGQRKACSHKLRYIQKEQMFDWVITDAPATDEEGHEVRVKRYLLSARPQGSETHYEIGPEYGGVIENTKLGLSSKVALERWWIDNRSEIAMVEMANGRNTLPPRDVQILVTAWVEADNGRISEAAEGVIVNLDITPADPVGFSFEPSGPLHNC